MDPNNWDLQAVVRGCNLTGPTVAATVDPFSSFPPLQLPGQEEEEVLMSFPDLSTTARTAALYELEDLCKPFTLHHPLPQQQQPNNPVEAQVPQQPKQPHRPQSQISKSKRRKNQQKKVVCEVPADGAPPDLWAWRKYGQKPIKGSPYPRGYYRCSSSKGCLARKQVERSRTNPGMLVITYTAEHNHPIPTHRSSLSGSTRHKVVPPSPSSGQPLAVSGGNPSSSSLSPSASAGLSPTTPLKFTMEDELLRPGKDEDGEAEEEDEGDENLLAVMGDDEMLFMDLEESIEPTTNAVISKVDLSAASASASASASGGGFEEHFLPSSWWTSNNTATAAGGS